jgi:hypothetical protein
LADVKGNIRATLDKLKVIKQILFMERRTGKTGAGIRRTPKSPKNIA